MNINWRLYLLYIMGLIAFCVLVSGLVYSSSRAKAFNSRPLVLIHSPIHHDQVIVGEGVIVHATARADNGLARMELWAGDTLVATREESDSNPTSVVISSHWLPMLAGNHVLTVRAVSTDGVEGQAAVDALAEEASLRA